MENLDNSGFAKSEEDKPETTSEKQPRNPAAFVGFLVILLAIGYLTWEKFSDKYAPTSSRGLIGANIAQIAPRVSGRITSIDVSSNTKVKAGDLLFRIDQRPYQIAADQAKNNLAQATQNLGANVADLAAAQANIAKARAAVENADIQLSRTQKLVERGIVAQAKLDTDIATSEQAQATLDAALSNAEALRRQIGDQGADNVQIRAAELAVEQAEYDLISTDIYAPADGVITTSHYAVGRYINSGTPAMTFIDTSYMWISSNMRENQLANIDPGDPAEIVFDAVPGKIFEARVESIVWGINPNYQEAEGLPVINPPSQWFEPARRVPVRVILENEANGWPEKARVGGKGYVVIYTEGREGIVPLLASYYLKAISFLTSFY